jgi:uncharacterized protein
VAGFLFAAFYVAMAVAALIVELIFGGFALVPSEHRARVVEASITWNYTTWLNLAFLRFLSGASSRQAAERCCA